MDPKLSIPFSGKTAQRPSPEQVELISKWVAIFSEHYHREISELGMATYIEGLKDLTPVELNYGCSLAIKVINRMPTVAHIQEIVNRYDESMLYHKREERQCKICRGTGWKDRGDGKYTRCEHVRNRL